MPAAPIITPFLHGQHAFTALRTLLGVVLPAGCALALYGNMEVAIGLALGAFCVSLADIPEALPRKPRRMLAATLVLACAAASIALVMHHPLAMWLVLLAVAFCAGLAVAYGPAGTLIGICALIGVDLMLAQHDAGGAPWPFLGWMVGGGLWYAAFATAVCALFPRQIAKRAVGESLMAAAAHLRRRADCFVPGIPLDQCHRHLAEAQSAVIDAQKVARDVVLRELAASRRHDPRQARLFAMLVGAIDIHDVSLALHGDFTTLRGGGAQSQGARQVHDTIREMAQWIEDLVPRYVLGRPVGPPVAARLDDGGLDTGPAQAFKARLAVLADTLAGLASVANAGAGKRGAPPAAPAASWPSDIPLAVQAWNRAGKWLMPWQALRGSPDALRYAMRLSAAIAVGTLVAKWIGGHGTWVILTIMIVMSPTFGASQQRSRQRIAGTLLGCLAAAVLLWCGVQAPWLLATLIVICYGVCFALARPASYPASVFFGTIAVLLLYHLLVPGWSMIEQRGVDTFIGGVIGALGAFVLPAWEHQGLDARLAAARQACRAYAAAVFADDFEMSRYRLARRDALGAVRTLAASHQRMAQEPPAKRRFTAEIGMWLAACNLMIAAVAALAQWRRSQGGAPLPAACRDGAALADRTLGGDTFTDAAHDGAASPRVSDGTPSAPPAPAFASLVSATRSMQRADRRLAAALRRTTPGAGRPCPSRQAPH
ncbi:hypothetical protein AKI39_09185 [Bordetella sp. H567]|uniref:FUSC family protein n=1 Tax=Bordetella sp. H567 TaxID=1697043 RepID=UPI00081D153F|nr:FUSC family membrane protein [Bordetella sp. H567]AOB30828.1 hypothetical protein AKI39_09185 [Bordetella sp. H567]